MKQTIKEPARLSAIAANLKKYSGSKCKYGHNGIRYTSTGHCVDCATRDKKVAL